MKSLFKFLCTFRGNRQNLVLRFISSKTSLFTVSSQLSVDTEGILPEQEKCISSELVSELSLEFRMPDPAGVDPDQTLNKYRIQPSRKTESDPRRQPGSDLYDLPFTFFFQYNRQYIWGN